ncbi:monocarboxylate transporter 10 isoform X2 [Nematostella vectensis]|uniref:monocarboxylate transporter 10 isoform X2 n=1 Tax=Nematostella vectensis TaxID=45351 RepID=UPI00138FF971|nr:monocarboxylate transporter 10 isoform X2 [Nematostella vectensis]
MSELPYTKDGPRAWCVCMAVTFINVILWGSTYTYGVIFPVLLDEFQEGKAKTAAKLSARLGPRPVSVIGALIAALGLFSTSQVNSIELMYLTYSVLFGTGASCVLIAGVDIYPQYFDKHFSLAVGIVQAGIGASFMMSPLLDFLLTSFGWRKTFLAMGGISLIAGIIPAVFFIPNVLQKTENALHPSETEVVPSQDLQSVWKNKALVVYSMTIFVMEFGNQIGMVHMGRYIQERGQGSDQAAFLYLAYGIATTIGRLVAGKILDVPFLNPVYVFAVFATLVGATTSACTLGRGFAWFMSYFVINGFSNGCAVGTIVLLTMTSVEPSQTAEGMGMWLMVDAFAFASGPAFGGYLADLLGSYVVVFYMAGGITITSAFVMLMVKCFGLEKQRMVTNTQRRQIVELMITYEKETVV